MKEREIEAAYRARFDGRRRAAEDLSALYEDAVAGRDAERRSWLVAVARPRLPRMGRRLSRDDARDIFGRTANLALVYASRASIHPLESVDRSNPRRGLRRWVAANTATEESSRWKESWISIHDDGAVSLTTHIGRHRISSDGYLGECQIEASAIESAIADLTALTRTAAETLGIPEYDAQVGIEWSGAEPLILLTEDQFGHDYDGGAIPLHRYIPVRATIDTSAAAEDYYWQVHDLAQDCITKVASSTSARFSRHPAPTRSARSAQSTRRPLLLWVAFDMPMNKRQRTDRLRRRRSASAPQASVIETTSRASYPKVKRAHIVPKVYQERFAVDGKVAVHIDAREKHELRTTAKVGVRSRAYRRVRPNGEEIDDIEESFAEMESVLPGPLERVAAGAPPEGLDKQKLAAFLGAQMVRGPAYREFYGEFFEREVRPAGKAVFTKRARRLHGGDVEAMQSEGQRLFADSSLQTIAMSEHARRYGAMLGNMTWQLLLFDEPVLAYSDAPVVLWPSAWRQLEPMPKQQFGPLEALEIRAPLSPQVAVVCVWADTRDPAPRRMPARVAAELNAFTISQRDRDWMHSPRAEPPVADGSFLPLSVRVVPGYSIKTMRASRRRRLVTQDVTSAREPLALTDSYSLYEIK